MKVWKYLVLLGGIAGIAGFFLPVISFESTDGGLHGSISAYQIVRGIDDVGELIEGTKPIVATSSEAQRFVRLFDDELGRYRGLLVAFYTPAALLALVGALAGVRRRMGRLAGVFAIALGIANAGLWLMFHDVDRNAAIAAHGTMTMGLGLHMLLAAGVAGTLAGLGALLAPHRGDRP